MDSVKTPESSSSPAKRTKTHLFKDMLLDKEMQFIMEAHNGLSAKIVEEAGFKGIWASGLSISASLGVRDCNEASWTQFLDVCEYMNDAVQIPILVDADQGFGNFNNARRFVKKAEQRGIAGICLEDKMFPKTNSFIGEHQTLAPIDEFSLKIRACKDSQEDDNLSIIARCEAFISGLGLREAMTRTQAYAGSGADAVLIHSKRADDKEIEEFMREWKASGNPQSGVPVVIVPTKYFKVPTGKFREMGVQLVIWANHNMRSCITAMQTTCADIFKAQSLASVEPRIASITEVFRLSGESELEEAEKLYLPGPSNPFMANPFM